MHNLKFDSVMNKGIKLFPGARLSNGNELLRNLFNYDLMKNTVGSHSLDEFEGKVYCYITNELMEIKTKEDMDKIGTSFTFYLLRIVQSFLMDLWEVKDNNIYARDGFLVVYEDSIENGFTYKSSLSAIFSNSTLDSNETWYTRGELDQAIKKFQENVSDMFKFDSSINYKTPTDDIFFKNKNSNRMERAFYFVLAARGNSALPMKIVYYCTALECLFSTAKTEINYRIAERIALMLGDNGTERKRYFNLIKKAYDVRSTIVHGSSLKGKSEELEEVSKGLDQVLRKLMITDNDIFNKEDKEIEDYFLNIIFDSGSKEDGSFT